MISLTHPVKIPQVDLLLREAVDRRARGEWTEERFVKPDGFPTFSIIMVVKNEWTTLMEAVQSVLPIADELIIGVDTQTDEPLVFAYESAYAVKPVHECDLWFDGFLAEGRMPTIGEIAGFMEVDEDILQTYCQTMAERKPTRLAAEACVEMVGKGKVFDLDFEDHFANSRNKTLEKATGEWCMFLDGHEILENATVLYDALEKLPKTHGDFYEILVKLKELEISCTPSIRQNRIFKRTPQAHFERGVHNTLVIPERDSNPSASAPVAIDDLVLVHDRPAFLARFRDPQRQRMTDKYMGDHEDSSSLYYTGLSAHRRKDYEKAIEAYSAYLDTAGDGPEPAVICGQLGKLYQDTKQDLELAEHYFLEGTKRCPDAAWCWLSLSYLRMKAAEAEENEPKRETLFGESLTFAKLASACEQPLSTMATPSTPFTWEPYLRMAYLYEQLNKLPEALESISKLREYEDTPANILSQSESAFADIQSRWVTDLSDRRRLSARDGQKVIAVYNHTGQFADEVLRIANDLGYRIKMFDTVDPDSAYCADIWWVEWAAENAAILSRMFKDDRKLVVRCHSYETFSQMPTSILWENVDVPLVSAPNVKNKLAEKFGLDTSRFKMLTVYPNPGDFPRSGEPETNDVVMLGRFSSKKGICRIPDLAALLPDRTIHVGGDIQDERLYDGVVEECLNRNLTNVRFYGHVSQGEVLYFLRKGAHYVCLSPWETLSVALAEAQLVGLSCHVLRYDWTDHLENSVAIRDSVHDIAESIRYRDDKPLLASRVLLEDKYNKMLEAIRGILS